MAKTQRKRIGPYRLLDELGKGGMGVVWHAIHEVLQREVAIKELVSRSAKDHEAIERFRREGMALAQLKHESIVGVHDLFMSAEKLYMVLEYVNGVTLHSLIKDGPLPWDVVAILGMRVAAALEHAHHHKLIHRDLKPANLMISKLGEVMLMDFGIARDQLLNDLTKTGFAVGTPSYMPPETLKGQKADGQSDLYSLGVTLYECATGTNPFAGADPQKAFANILSGKWQPLKKLAPELPKGLRRIIERCLQLSPKKRFKTAADLRQELEMLLQRSGARANHRQRLIGFLRAQGKISETEALTCMNAAELAETSFEELKPRRLGRRLAIAATLLSMLGGGGYYVWAQTDLVSRLNLHQYFAWLP